MSFSLDPQSGWSCPVRVDKPFLRRSLCVFGRETPLPLVLTSYQSKGQTYLAIHRDDRPQLFIENRTDTVMFCAQSIGGSNVVTESQHLKWNCRLPKKTSVFYTVPLQQEKFPELPQDNFAEKIALAIDSESKFFKFIN